MLPKSWLKIDVKPISKCADGILYFYYLNTKTFKSEEAYQQK